VQIVVILVNFAADWRTGVFVGWHDGLWLNWS